MLPSWQGGVATAIATAAAAVLVILDLADRTLRRFWAGHALTTDTVAGLLVLSLTVLVVNQVLARRQYADRSRVVAAQAGFMLAQARRCVQTVRSYQSGSADRDAAVEEARSYSLMLMVAAPVLIDFPVARAFLDQAQRLAGALASVLVLPETDKPRAGKDDQRLDDAIDHLKAAANPLLAALTDTERSLVQGEAS